MRCAVRTMQSTRMIPRMRNVRHLNGEGGNIVCGTNPCNWAVIERCWEGDSAVSVERMLQDMGSAGYKATDLGDLGFIPDAKATLNAAGVDLMGAFVEISLSAFEVPQHELDILDEVGQVMAQFAGQRYPAHIVLADQGDSDVRQRNAGRITAAMGMTADEQQNFLSNLRMICERAPCPVYFHPHCGSRVETVAEVQWLLAHSDVDLVFDTGHLVYASAGQVDLVKLLNEWEDRIGTFHFKDISEGGMVKSADEGWTYLEAVKKGNLVVNLGAGMIDFEPLTQWQRETQYKGFVCVEQETFDWSSAGEDMAYNHRYLSTLYQQP